MAQRGHPKRVEVAARIPLERGEKSAQKARMKPWVTAAVGAVALAACATAQLSEREALAAGWSRVVIQPNGWGANPAEATRDLDRVMGIYTNQPGFRQDAYVKIIPISKNVFQADGRCSYLAPKR